MKSLVTLQAQVINHGYYFPLTSLNTLYVELPSTISITFPIVISRHKSFSLVIVNE